MSIGKRIEALALRWPCPYCDADTDQWCVTHHWSDRDHKLPPTGTAVYLHGARTRDLYDLQWSAREKGRQDGRAQGHWSVARALDPHAVYRGAELVKWLEQRCEEIMREGV